MQSVYEAAGSSEGLFRLAEAWHSRVMADEIVSHAFSHGFHPQHTERLAAYWAEALGGPTTYSDTYGDETSVVRLHSGNGPHEEMDRRAIACFDQALTDTGLDADGRLRAVLHDYFSWATTVAMTKYHASAADVPYGQYVERVDLSALASWDQQTFRHQRLVRAAMNSMRPGSAVVSHHSARVLHGIPVWRADLTEVQ